MIMNAVGFSIERYFMLIDDTVIIFCFIAPDIKFFLGQSYFFYNFFMKQCSIKWVRKIFNNEVLHFINAVIIAGFPYKFFFIFFVDYCTISQTQFFAIIF